MFLFYSFCSALQQRIDYNISTPIKTTKLGECGLWSLLGCSTNMKNSFHFMPDNLHQNGSVCHRIPTSSRKFSAEFNASVENGFLTFSFTEEVCPYSALTTNTKTWNGFSLVMTQHRESSTKFLLHVGSPANVSEHSLCLAASRNFKVNVEVENSTVAVFVDGQKCGEAFEFPFNYIGFFSFVGSLVNDTKKGEKKQIGSSDIFSLNVSIPEDHSEDFDLVGIEKFSRNMIARQLNLKNSGIRKTFLAEIVNKQALNAFDKLDENPDPREMEGMIRAVINEFARRLNLTLTNEQLNELIEMKVKKNLARLEAKMNKRKESFKKVSDDLNNYVKEVNNKMDWISAYSVDQIASLKQEYMDQMKQFVKEHDPRELSKETNKNAKEMKTQWIQPMLLVIALIEIACYVAFFFYKRKETHAFKKYD